jgi:hypothetical protein
MKISIEYDEYQRFVKTFKKENILDKDSDKLSTIVLIYIR